jgi:hypothetical protein
MFCGMGVGAYAASSASGSPDLTGTWKVVNTSGPGAGGTLVITNGKGGAFDGTGYGGGYVVRGTVSGSSVHYTVSDSSYSATFVGTLSDDDTRITYSWTDSNGQQGTAYIEKHQVRASLTVEVSAPVSKDEAVPAMEVGDVVGVTVTVTASGADFKDVSLRNGGLIVMPARCGTQGDVKKVDAVTITYAPPLASGFPLDAGASRTFEFKVRGRHDGPARLKVDARGETAAGETAEASNSTNIDVGAYLTHIGPSGTSSGCVLSVSGESGHPSSTR